LVHRSSPAILRVRRRLALFRPARLLRRSLQWRQLRSLLDADADRAGLELRLIKLSFGDARRIPLFAYDAGRSRGGEARPASSIARMPVRNMPSNVPAPPMEAIGAPRLPILSRLRISAPSSVPMDPPI